MGSHIVSLRQTFDQSLIKILLGVKEIWSGHEIQWSNSGPSIVTLILSRHGFCTSLTKVNIRPKFNENLSKGSGAMDSTQKSYNREMDKLMDRQADKSHSYNPHN